MSNFDQLMNEVATENSGGANKVVDTGYISQFFRDADKFLSDSESSFGNMSWADATNEETYKKYNDSVFSINSRADLIEKYLKANRSSFSDADYKTWEDAINGYRQRIALNRALYEESQKYYSQFASEKDFEAAQKYLPKYNGKSMEELQNFYNALGDGEQKTWLGNYISQLKAVDTYENLTKLDQLKEDYNDQWGAYYTAKNTGNFGGNALQNQRAIDLFESTQQAKLDTEEKITEQDKYYWYQSKMIQSAYDDPEFEALAAAGAEIRNSEGSSVSDREFGAMTDDQKKLYSYFLAKDRKDGTELTDRFLYFIKEEVNQKLGEETAEKYKDDPIMSILYGAHAGLDLFAGGLKSWVNNIIGAAANYDDETNYTPTNEMQYASGLIRENMGDTGIPWYNFATGKWESILGDVDIFGNSIGQIAFDSANTVANMAPSILVSKLVSLVAGKVGPVVGGATLGASAAGNAYEQKIREGWTAAEARSYANMTGFSEAALEAVLGAVGSAGGSGAKGLLSKFGQQTVAKVDNVIAKVAKSAGGKLAANALGEGLEEGIQSILEPYFAKIAAGKELPVNWEEVLYSSLLGAIMGFGFGAVDVNTWTNNNPELSAEFDRAVNARVNEQQMLLKRTLTDAEVKEIQNTIREEMKSKLNTSRPVPYLSDQSTASTPVTPAVESTVQPVEPAAPQPTVGKAPAVTAPTQHVDALANVEDLLRAAKPDPITDAVRSYSQSGILSDEKVDSILANPEAVQQLSQQTGIPIEGTKSQQRAAVKEAVEKIDEHTVDNTAAATYDNTTNQGGTYNGQRLQQNDRAGSLGNSAEGMAGVQPANRAEFEGRKQSGGVAVGSGVLRVSQELQSAQASRGTPTYPIYDTTAKPDFYAAALEAGRASDVKNGWCVTPKTAQDLQSENVRTVMNADGTVGAGIAPNGDIVAVFKNKNGGPAKALHTLMPAVIEQGGDRLDCYGEGLVGVYAQYGFIPVARVEFNPEHANDGWTPDKGTPYIYFMAHNGDSAAVVAEKIGEYPEITKQKLDSLPTFGKEAYDEAMAYRDNYMDRKKASAPSPNESVGAAPAGFDQYSNLQYKYGNKPDRANTVRDINVPNRDSQGRRVSDYAANIYGNQITSDQMIPELERRIEEGYFGADVKHLSDIRNSAEQSVRDNGVEASADKVKNAVIKGEYNEDLFAQAQVLFNYYQSVGDMTKAGDMAVYSAQIAQAGGRILNVAKMTQTLTPEGQLQARLRIAEMVDNRTPKRKNAAPIAVSEETQQNFKNVSTANEAIITDAVKSLSGSLDLDMEAAAQAAIKNTLSDSLNLDTEAQPTPEQKGAGVDLQSLIAKSAKDKAAALAEIQKYVKDTYHLDEASASEMATQLQESFFEKLSRRQTNRLISMFGQKDTAPKTQKTVMEKFRELYNLGAFTKDAFISREALKKLFGVDGLTLSEETLRQYGEISDARKAEMDQRILQEIADQRPLTFKEAYRKWRYTAMLSNPSTHIKNLSGNLGQFIIQYGLKDPVAVALQSVSGKAVSKTKAILNPFSKADLDLVNKAWNDYGTIMNNDGEVAKRIKNGGKYYSVQSEVEDLRKSFKALDVVSGFNTKALDVEDAIFGKTSYAASLAGYMKANNLTEITEEARAYAIAQAQEATFHDDSLIYQKVRKLVGDGNVFVPFVKTPANITSRAFEYSPGMLVKAGVDMAKAVHGKDSAAAAKAINNASKGIVGASLYGVGAWMAAQGLLRVVGSGDKEKREYESMIGYKDFSICLGGVYIDADFLIPAILPMLTGAAVYETAVNMSKESVSVTNVINALYSVTDPILSASFLDGFSGLVYAVREMDGAMSGALAGTVLAEMIENYISQSIPSLVRRIANASDNTSREIYGDPDNPLAEFGQNILSGIPGASTALKEKYDVWGQPFDRNTVNGADPLSWLWRVITPANSYDVHGTAFDDEIQRLQGLGLKALPSENQTTVSVNGNRIRLNQTQHETYERVEGQASYALVEQIISSDAYKALTDEQKVAVLQKAYSAADKIGLAAALGEDYKIPAGSITGVDEDSGAVMIREGILSVIDSGFSDLTKAWKNGTDSSGVIPGLQAAYDALGKMSEEDRAALTSELSGRSRSFVAALDAGISADIFAQAYQKYYELEGSDEKASQKALQWSSYLERLEDEGTLTDQQKNVLRSSMKFYQMNPADTNVFDRLIENGVETGDADYIMSLFSGLTAEEGHSSVRTVQKYEAIANAEGLTEEEKQAAMLAFIPDDDKMEGYFRKAIAKGYSTEDFAEAYRANVDHAQRAKFLQAMKNSGYSPADAIWFYNLYHGK